MLTVVATPIGNMQDISFRAGRAILDAEFILAEDTRSAGMLRAKLAETFQHPIHPSQQLVSYYKEREFERLPYVFELLEADHRVILLSENGMPLISDPGHLLIQKMIARDMHFEVIPGPTALTTAIVHSGFDPTRFAFMGFLPKKDSEIAKQLRLAHDSPLALSFIWYESPNRIQKTLRALAQIDPAAQVCVCRELTKKFEEVVRGAPLELAEREYRGEITLVVSFSSS